MLYAMCQVLGQSKDVLSNLPTVNAGQNPHYCKAPKPGQAWENLILGARPGLLT